MNRSPIIEPTKFLSMEGSTEQIEVDSLPKELRFEVETLDRISQQKLDKLMELEILELAWHAQKMKVAGLLGQHNAAKAAPKNLSDEGGFK